MPQAIGILTAGGDSPGLNAAIRAVGKTAQRAYGMKVIGFRDGFEGLMQDRSIPLDDIDLSGILTKGGTVLGTSRLKVHKVELGEDRPVDMRPAMRKVVERHDLAALVCIGGGGTQKNAQRLAAAGIPVVTLPKTIDNDVWGTDVTLGYDTALGIASEAVDRLHSTAHSHHRIMLVEIMGHNAGWLTLGAGLAGGVDVILVPEVPYRLDAVADSIMLRKASGSAFSIVAVAEGAMAVDLRARHDELKTIIDSTDDEDVERHAETELAALHATTSRSTEELAANLSALTGLEARVTILGHVQRGGTPSPEDRLLATQLGTAAVDLIAEGMSGVMVASRNGEAVPVPLERVAGRRKTVPLSHPWIHSARNLGVCLGD